MNDTIIYSLMQSLPFGEVGGVTANYVSGQYYCIIRNNNKIVNTIKFNIAR